MPDLASPAGPPAFPKPVIHHSLDHFPSTGRAANVDSDARSEVVNAMRERITQMEEEVKMMKSKAKGAEDQVRRHLRAIDSTTNSNVIKTSIAGSPLGGVSQGRQQKDDACDKKVHPGPRGEGSRVQDVASFPWI